MDLQCNENPKSKITNSSKYIYHSLKNVHQEIDGANRPYSQKQNTSSPPNKAYNKLINDMHL
jgi:hypothetical protein